MRTVITLQVRSFSTSSISKSPLLGAKSTRKRKVTRIRKIANSNCNTRGKTFKSQSFKILSAIMPASISIFFSSNSPLIRAISASCWALFSSIASLCAILNINVTIAYNWLLWKCWNFLMNHLENWANIRLKKNLVLLHKLEIVFYQKTSTDLLFSRLPNASLSISVDHSSTTP